MGAARGGVKTGGQSAACFRGVAVGTEHLLVWGWLRRDGPGVVGPRFDLNMLMKIKKIVQKKTKISKKNNVEKDCKFNVTVTGASWVPTPNPLWFFI